MFPEITYRIYVEYTDHVDYEPGDYHNLQHAIEHAKFLKERGVDWAMHTIVDTCVVLIAKAVVWKG